MLSLSTPRNALVLGLFLGLPTGCDLVGRALEKKKDAGAGGGTVTPIAPKARGPNETALARYAKIDAVAVDSGFVYWRSGDKIVRRLPKNGGELKELGKATETDGPILPSAGALYIHEFQVVGDSRYWRMPAEGGAAVALEAPDDVTSAGVAPDGRELFAACQQGSKPTRICALRGGASAYQLLGETAPGTVLQTAVDRTHVWWQVKTIEKSHPKSSLSTEVSQLQRMPRAGGAVESGARAKTATCYAFAVDDENLYCASETTVRQARKAIAPLWQTMATVPARADHIVLDSRSLFVRLIDGSVMRISKNAVGAVLAQEKVATVGSSDAYAVDEDALYYGDGDELVRRSTK